MNVTSLALSLSGVLLWITVVPGIIFGHLGRAAAKRGEADNGGLGLAGLISGYVILAVGTALGIAYVLFLAAYSMCDAGDPRNWCSTESLVSRMISAH